MFKGCWTARLADSVLEMIKFMDKRKKEGKTSKKGKEESDDLTAFFVEKCGTPLDKSQFRGLNFEDV